MKLTCFRTGAQLTAGKLPERIRLLNWGDNPSAKGVTPKLGDKSLATFAANQKRFGFDRVALDYEHNTVPGSQAFSSSNEPRKVAGYGVPLLVPGDGLFLDLVTYTPSGVENAPEYIDVSGAVKLDPETGEVVFLHSAALCRQGAVEGMSLFAVDIDDPKVVAEDPPAPMDWKRFIADLLGKPIETADAELKDAFAEYVEAAVGTAVEAMSARVDALATSAAPAKDLTTLSATVSDLKGRLTTLSADLEARDRADVCRQAALDGKVLPLSADQIATTPLVTLREMVGKLPVTVPLHRRTPERIETLSVGQVPSATLERVARQCGIDPAKVVQNTAA